MSVRVTCNRCSSEELKTLYCACTNTHCGHTFAAHLSFSHTISPANGVIPTSVLDKLQTMNPQQQRELFNVLV